MNPSFFLVRSADKILKSESPEGARER